MLGGELVAGPPVVQSLPLPRLQHWLAPWLFTAAVDLPPLGALPEVEVE